MSILKFDVGSKVFYRPLYNKNIEESIVISVDRFVNYNGDVSVFLKLANGERVEAERCYVKDNKTTSETFASNFEVNHFLIDVQDGQIITQKRMTIAEKEKLNAEAQKVGEKFLVWVPAVDASLNMEV